ncbi:MAG TPA: tetratricopeptide repeat protein [Tepidiformaceae bacterium]|nr:tetratricopeptide repeat protein [Tepidiformaceae bacterium]
MILSVAILFAFARLFSAGFVLFDDDFQIYANPFLNPPTLESIARFWQHSYQQLYIPLAYTILGAIAKVAGVPGHVDSSLGQAVSLDPTAFHAVSVLLHLGNAWLCFRLIRRLTGRTRAALLCSLVFALHPLQVESVAWLSELRGLTSSAFGLAALNAFVLWRQESERARSRKLMAVSVLLVGCALLCKPSAAVLPLVALAIDRIALRTRWREALTGVGLWAALAIPFVLITRTIQPVPVGGHSLLWQRPFIAGDSLAFYVFKALWPVDLGIDYGRTPTSVMSHSWGYLAWMVPVTLLVAAYLNRRRRPNTWLGAVFFLTFLLPTLGLVPFAYQAYSTVADRYMYLALIGVGLIVSEAFDYVRPQRVAMLGAATLFITLAVLSFNQSGHWLTNSAFLRHTIEVNPSAGFAYNNLGDTALAKGDLNEALTDYKACIERDSARTRAYINLAEVYTALNQPADAERAIAQAEKTPEMTSDDLTNLGIVLMKMNQPARALQALATAVSIDPGSPTYLFNQANALSATGQFAEAEAAFRRCIELAPTLAGAHTGLGIVLAETRRLPDALTEFRTAVRLQPNDSAALDDLKRAEDLMRAQGAR